MATDGNSEEKTQLKSLVKRDERGRLLPGTGGLPGSGRPEGLAQYVRRRTFEGKELVDFLVLVVRGQHKGMTGRDRIDAAKTLLDRGFGKAPELIATADLTSDARRALTSLSVEELRALAALPASVLGGSHGGSQSDDPSEQAAEIIGERLK